MRRLALPALAGLLALSLPGTVLAAGLGARDAGCPQGPRRVASHTDMETSLDREAVSVYFALENGCRDVDVSLLSYQLVAGPTVQDQTEQVLYDIETAKASAGQVNSLQVVVVPDCWSMVKLVVGRPPAGTVDPARVLAWDRENTVYSKWDGDSSVCTSLASSPLAEDGLLGSLLQPPGSAAGAAPGLTGTGPAAPGSAGGAPAGSPSAGPGLAAGGGAAAYSGESTGLGSGTGSDGDGGEGTAGGTGAAVTEEPGAPDGDQLSASPPGDTDGDGALPLTGTPAASLLLAGLTLVTAGMLLRRLGRRYRARHLARNGSVRDWLGVTGP